ncbi:MAG: quinolinate synthase NadA [Candidatus Marinimicrobia bacterium]|nr:quinolinate synthase NadA [Candidatus Neomarinimicrobiota bacterium]
MNKPIIEKIKKLKKERNAVILVHNYQLPEVQDIADYIGDSLGLSIQASKTEADVIIFCGVYFMAETAKILSPDKIVLIPDKTAGCPMADMITKEKLVELKKTNPDAKVVAYVNTTAEVKTECDICCTSSNAELVVKNFTKDIEKLIFIPDKYLGSYIANKLGKEFILYDGYCPSHVKIMEEDIKREKEKHPEAKILVHPECISEVIKLADAVLSTDGMVKYAKNSNAKEFIIGTEIGIIHRLQKENPDKKFYPASNLAICPNMKKITLEKVYWSLEEMKYEVILNKETIEKARNPIEKMISLVK